VLDEHFIDGGPADVGIERPLADRQEALEGGLEFLVALVGLVQLAYQPLGQFRHAVLGLPKAQARVVKRVADSAVRENVVLADLDFLLGDEGAVVQLGRVREQALESSFQGAFVGDALFPVVFQRLVILLDSLVSRFDKRRLRHERPNLAEGRKTRGRR